MIKADATVKKETKYIAYSGLILSMFMNVVFVVLKKWDYTVILGNLLSLVIGTLNFYFMGLTVQKAITKDPDDAKKLMKSSHSLRNVGIFVGVVIGVVLSCFNTVAVLISLFFPRIAVMFRPFIKEKGSDK